MLRLFPRSSSVSRPNLPTLSRRWSTVTSFVTLRQLYQSGTEALARSQFVQRCVVARTPLGSTSRLHNLFLNPHPQSEALTLSVKHLINLVAHRCNTLLRGKKRAKALSLVLVTLLCFSVIGKHQQTIICDCSPIQTIARTY